MALRSAKVGDGFKPTPEQTKIFQAVKKRSDNLLVEALAGTGKSTTIERMLKGLPKRCGVMAFNKSIATEMQQRMTSKIWAGTMHSRGYGELAKLVGKRLEMDKYKYFSLVREVFEVTGQKKAEVADTARLIGLVRDTVPEAFDVWDHAPIFLGEIAEKFGLNPMLDAVKIRKVMDRGLEMAAEGKIDYTDMIWGPETLGLKPNPFELLAVDEAQDLNPLQIRFATRRGERIVAVGDKNQCQPVGTMVQVTGKGQVPIEELEIGMMLATYNSQKSYAPGFNSQGRKIEAIQKREFAGLLIEANGTRTTPNHRWLVRFNEKAKKKWAVYLMMVKGVPRLGLTQLLCEFGFGPGMRARQEHADALWILELFDNREEARKMEWMMSMKYQISQRAMSEPTKPDWARELEQELSASRIESLFEDLTLKNPLLTLEYPFWERGENQHVGSYSFMVRGCNLLPEVMEVVRVRSPRDCQWETLELDYEYYEGWVYSLQVEQTENKRRLYIADEIVTGNSIYGFRGADPFAIETLTAALEPMTLPLSVTMRCPKQIVRLANRLVPTLSPREDAAEGTIEEGVYEEELPERLVGGELVLSRVNAPLTRLLFRLWIKGVPAKIIGRDYAAYLLDTLDRCGNCSSITELTQRIQMQLEAEKLKNSQMKITVIDACETLLEIVDRCDSIGEVKSTINRIFVDQTEKGTTRLSTIHRAKGLEAETVVLLNPELLPHPMAEKPWEIAQELNLAYVAVTRVKGDGRLLVVGFLPDCLVS